jgi:uncharacterized protein YfaS (alpha-2-macroglobulin family)
MLRYDPEPPEAKRLWVAVDGKRVLDLQDARSLKKSTYRVQLEGRNLPDKDALRIEMGLDAAEPATFMVTALGVQRLDKLEPEGDAVRVRRCLRTSEGMPLEQPARVGDVFAMQIRLQLEQPQSYLIVEAPRPAGCEFADDILAGPVAGRAAHVEFRDDRVAAFFSELPAGRHELVYYLRAETRGMTHMLPAVAYPMYNESLRGRSSACQLRVVAPGVP